MSLASEEIDRIAGDIVAAYRAGRVSHDAGFLRLDGMADAEDVQDAVLRMLGDAQVGYALVATSATISRLLGCLDPVVAPLLRGALIEDGATFLLPHGTIGAGAGFCFVLGVPSRAGRMGLPTRTRRPTPALLAISNCTSSAGGSPMARP